MIKTLLVTSYFILMGLFLTGCGQSKDQQATQTAVAATSNLEALLTAIPTPALAPTSTYTLIPTTPDFNEPLKRFVLSFDPSVQLQPGEQYQFRVGDIRCCYFFDPLDVKAIWSFSPSSGAKIDRNGLFTVDENTPSGSVFRVTADINNGQATAGIDVYIYRTQDNPLIGTWQEDKWLACSSELLVTPDQLIRELIFRADGTFSVTWQPFEIYTDYFGKYQYDMQNGSLELTIENGNYIPSDVDTSGSFYIDGDNRLILKDLWLGSSRDSSSPAQCGHRFIKYLP